MRRKFVMMPIFDKQWKSMGLTEYKVAQESRKLADMQAVSTAEGRECQT